MKNNIRISVALVALAGLGAVACTDLTTEPKSTVTTANIFNETSSYKAFLAKLYGGLVLTGQQGPYGDRDIEAITDEGFSSYQRMYWNLQELTTDEAINGWNDAAMNELNAQTWSSTNQFLYGMYSRVYFQAGLANEFLRQTEDDVLAARNVPQNLRTEIQHYRAEARFLRALGYWHGIDLFGDIPLVLEDDPVGATPPEPSTRAEVFSFLVQELNEIKAELPAAGAGQYGRADQGAVGMLLAKLYLNAAVYGVGTKWGDVITALQPVLTAYQLDDDYRHIFMADNHSSREIIFPIPQDGKKAQTYGGTTYLIHAAIGADMAPGGSAGAWGMNWGWGGNRVRQQFVALFPNGPARPDQRGKILWSAGQNLNVTDMKDFRSGYAAPKFSNKTSTGANGSDPEFADTDFPLFRLGDAYLMYAEAVVRGGGGSRTTALGYINALRGRVNAPTISDAEMTLPFIIAERGRELYWEAHRRTDLIRFGMFTGNSYVWAFKGNTVAGTATDPSRNLFPIPANQCVANPNLKGIGGC